MSDSRSMWNVVVTTLAIMVLLTPVLYIVDKAVEPYKEGVEMSEEPAKSRLEEEAKTLSANGIYPLRAVREAMEVLEKAGFSEDEIVSLGPVLVMTDSYPAIAARVLARARKALGGVDGDATD